MQPLSEQQAADRHQQIRPQGVLIELNLREAQNPKEQFFRTRTVWQLVSHADETFLDFSGEVIYLHGPSQLRWEHKADRIRLTSLPVGVPFSIEICARAPFSRTGEGLHRVIDPQDNQCYLYTHCEPNDANRYFPCFDQPSIKVPITWQVIAPSNWEVITNGRHQDSSPEQHGYTRHRFLPTAPLPAYLTAMCAGPFARFTDKYERSDGTQVPLGLFCRQSRREDFDPEDIFTVTKQGLGYFEQAYNYLYPWAKYDQVFVPEYNIGAMENPGCVTFNEDSYVFSGPPTEAGRAKRADTILHEMCHMWFGDLVTPHWWDDLWLKESFADYSGHAAAKAVTRYQDEDATVSVGRKEWAYRFDQYPTTHPILTSVSDTQVARQAFDAITYAKGAAVLRQLVTFVGTKSFHAAAGDYFQKKAHGTATLHDFLSALQAHCELDVHYWSNRWLETVGPSQMHLELSCDAQGQIKKARLLQTNRDFRTAVGGKSEIAVIRPHLLNVGCYDLSPTNTVVKRQSIEIFTDEQSVDIPQLIGQKRPDLLLLNDEDLTYAICVPDARSQEFLVHHLSGLPTLEAQGVAWSILWNAVRDTRLHAESFARCLLTHLPALQAESMLVTLLDRAWYTLARYLLGKPRETLVEEFISLAWQQTRWWAKNVNGRNFSAVGLARAWAGGALKFATLAKDEKSVSLAKEMLQELQTGQLLELDNSLRWFIAEAGASLGALTTVQLEALAHADPSVAGKAAYLKVRQLLEENSGQALVQHSYGEHTNEELAALVQGFNRPAHADFCLHWVGEYLQQVPKQFLTRSQTMALKWVQGFFPSWIEASGEAWHQAVATIENWLAQQTDPSLHRCISESLAELKRDLAVQSKSIAQDPTSQLEIR